MASGNSNFIWSLRAPEVLAFYGRLYGLHGRALARKVDELLAQAGLPGDDIDGYERVERSHGAVALAVASGNADVGLGTEYAARNAGLGFVPLTDERYLLVCLKAALDEPALKRLLGHLQSSDWQARLRALPGYTPDHCGEVAAMKRLLPWWD